MNPEQRAAKQEYLRRWAQENRDRIRAYREATKDRRNARRRERYATDTEHREQIKAAVREWWKAHPEIKKAQRLKKFGISLEVFRNLMELQDGRCAICKHADLTDPNFFPVVDHCHATGVVRGLLCLNCNQGLGKFKDDPTLLSAAINYLVERSGSSGADSTMSRTPSPAP